MTSRFAKTEKGAGLDITVFGDWRSAMARPLRIEFPGAIYHVTARGNAREAIFHDDADRELFLDTLGGVVTRFGGPCWKARANPMREGSITPA